MNKSTVPRRSRGLKEFGLMISVMVMFAACAVGPVASSDNAQASSDAEAWLTKIEQKAHEVEALSAKVRYTREQGLLGDVQHRYGTLVYDAGPPARFRLRFDRVAVDRALHEMDTAYVFDGRYMVERDNDERIFSRWELAEQGEQLDLLALGEGPFALPLNMNKADVLARFDVQLAESEEDEPSQIHLVLTPHEEQDLKVDRIELWFDHESLLPVRARQVEGDDVTDVKLGEIEPIDPDTIEGGVFDTAPPSGGGWEVNDHPRKPPEAQQ